jgi:hypothetical protein
VSKEDTRQSTLCRVPVWQHSAKTNKSRFVECQSGGTRQNEFLYFLKNLCRVPAIWHSVKPLNNKPVVFLSSSLSISTSPPRAARPPALARRQPTRAAPAPSAAGHAASPSAPPPRRQAARRRPYASSPSLRPGHPPRSGHLRHPPRSGHFRQPPRFGHLPQPPPLRLRYTIYEIVI